MKNPQGLLVVLFMNLCFCGAKEQSLDKTLQHLLSWDSPQLMEYDISTTAVEGLYSSGINSLEELHQKQARRNLLYYFDCGDLVKGGDAEVR